MIDFCPTNESEGATLITYDRHFLRIKEYVSYELVLL